ncbi:MAG: amidohydrolase family protein [Planctomycetaceae bacterium]|nr:amidohydrolase family protein [Planctomycetaceae bacterium]
MPRQFGQFRKNIMQLRGRRYDTGEPIVVTIRDDRIAAITPAHPVGDAAEWPFVAPGLFDMQINGFGGTWFSDEELTAEQAVAALMPWFRFGVTRLCPTLITNSYEALERGLTAIRQVCEQHPWADRLVAGCHVEGPYLSREDGPRGAHPLHHVRAPDWVEFQRLQEASGGRIRLLTISPEWDNTAEFIAQVVKSNVVVAIGHTAATPEQIHAAADAGATFSTHLGNGCHAQIHRHRNPLIAQLADDRLMTGVISDGHHLPADWLKVILKAKSPKRVVVTCDASGWAGCTPGVYTGKLGSCEILPSGKLVVAGQQELLAGSADTTDVCVARLIAATGCSLRDAIEMASLTPAEMLRLESPRLAPGGRADLFLFDHDPRAATLRVHATVAAGTLEFGDPAIAS